MTPTKRAAPVEAESRPPVDPPDFSYNAGIFLFHWPKLKIKLRIDRLYQSSSFEVSGEVTIKQDVDGEEYHISQSRLNMTGAMSRKNLAKELEACVPLGDWKTILEQACIKTLVKYREGEAVEGIGNECIEQKREYRLDPIIIEGAPTGMYAPGGSGKGQVAVLIICLIHYGWEWGTWTAKKGNGLYLDWETSKREINRRVFCMKRGLGIEDTSEIQYRRCFHPLADDIEEIQARVLEKDIKFVVIDSFGLACMGDNNKEEAVLRFYNAFRSLNIPGLIVDHSNKEGELYGNSYKWNAVRSLFEIKKVGESRDDGTIDLNLIHKKINEGSMLPTRGIRFTFLDNDLMTLPEPVDITLAALQAKLANKDAIIEKLKRGTLSAKEVGALTGISQSTVRSILNRGLDTLFVKIGTEWGLKANVPSLLEPR